MLLKAEGARHIGQTGWRLQNRRHRPQLYLVYSVKTQFLRPGNLLNMLHHVYNEIPFNPLIIIMSTRITIK